VILFPGERLNRADTRINRYGARHRCKIPGREE
jgi:hypothetical protein